MKRRTKIVRLASLSDKYRSGNEVIAPWGLSPCITEAAGCGGAYTADSNYTENRMKRVIPATEERLSNAITASYGNGGVSARNLYYGCLHPKAAVLEITRVK